MKNKRLIKDVLTVIAGNLIYSFAVAFFILPSGLVTGGLTGIGITVNRLTGIDIPLFMFLSNSLLFAVGWIFLGRKFALTALISTFEYPITLALFQKLIGNYKLTDDIVICTLLGGVLIGIAVGLTIRAGSSTGGMDIPSLIISKYSKLSVSSVMWAIDFVILFFEGFFFPSRQLLYGIVLVIIYSAVLERTILFGKQKAEIKVISEKSDQIREAVLSTLDRGATLFYAKTGYAQKNTAVLLTVVSSRQLHSAEKLIYSIDEKAFVIVNNLSRVIGTGF